MFQPVVREGAVLAAGIAFHLDGDLLFVFRDGSCYLNFCHPQIYQISFDNVTDSLTDLALI